jgi:hypothetical protein
MNSFSPEVWSKLAKLAWFNAIGLLLEPVPVPFGENQTVVTASDREAPATAQRISNSQNAAQRLSGAWTVRGRCVGRAVKGDERWVRITGYI